MNNILVTGAAGYIGSHFVRRYLDKKPGKVIAVDNLTRGHRQSLPEKHDRLQLVDGNMGDYRSMLSVLKDNKVEAVVHFAAYAYVGESQEQPFMYFDNNVVGSLNLFKAMQEARVKKIVFSSTCATYGNPDYCPIDEDHKQAPVSTYGTTKWMVEKAIDALAESSKWSYVSLRYFNASGADDSGEIGESHDPETHIIPLALQTALGQREVLSIYGDDYETPDGTCIRDYIHVNDLADAHINALDKLGNEDLRLSVNLGSSVGASVKEVVNLCQEISGRPIATKFSPRRAGDAVRLFANHQRASEILGWQPQYDLKRIIETAWKWETNRKF